MSGWQPTRDLMGYGQTPPDPKWPDGARVAVNFVMNYEEGSEPSMQDGEGYTETGLTESTSSAVGMNGRDLAGESMFEYGSRVGFWRLMRAFQERGLPMTVFGCALALERNPAAAEAIKKSGFDVCSHGWRWIKHFTLSEEEEREHIAKAVKSFQQTVGQSPAGWYCRYGPSVNTRRLVVDCGDAAGYALACLRAGVKRISMDPADDKINDKIADIARQMGAELVRRPT